MKKSPLIVFTGLAVAAVAGVLGITRDRWMGEAPVTVASQSATGGETTIASTETASGASTATKTEEPAAASETQETAAVAAPAEETTTAAAEQEGSADAPAEQAAATTTEQTPAPAAETESAASATTTTTTTTTTTVEATAETQAEPVAEVAANTASETPEAAATGGETKPAFDTVRVEKTGEAVIAGTAEAGAEVVVKLDGEAIGTATANADGAFVVVPDKALPQGSGAITIEAKGANETTVVKSDQSVAVMVPAAEEKKEALVAVISPNEPTKVLQKPTADIANSPVSLDAVDYDGAGNIVFNGRATPGTVVRLYVDNQVAGDAKADDEGRWTFTGATAMTPGNHMLRVDAIDGAGKVTSRVELPFVREDQAKVAAATTTAGEETAAVATEGEAATASDSAETQQQPVAAPKDGRVVIQPGNNLWRISKVIYGDGRNYSVIYEANRDLIRDPDLIYPGQIFETPNVVPPEKIDPEQRDPIAATQ